GRPLFESIFIFENHAAPQDGPLRARTGRAFERTSYPVTVIVGVVPDVSLKILYDTSVVGRDAVERLLNQLVRLLAEIGRDAGRRVGDLPRMDAGERRQVLALSRGPEARTADRCVHELVSERAAER